MSEHARSLTAVVASASFAALSVYFMSTTGSQSSSEELGAGIAGAAGSLILSGSLACLAVDQCRQLQPKLQAEAEIAAQTELDAQAHAAMSLPQGQV